MSRSLDIALLCVRKHSCLYIEISAEFDLIGLVREVIGVVRGKVAPCRFR